MNEKSTLGIAPNLSYETIDGETIVVNLDKGYYYSLQNTASVIWKCFESTCDTSAICYLLTSHFDHPNEQVEMDLDSFCRILQEEGLLIESDRQPEALKPFEIPVSHYSAPELEKYTDMEDLLILDPIHETDEQGWPHQNLMKAE